MSILSAFDKYMKSPAGKKRLSDKISEYRKAGVTKTQAGSELVTEAALRNMAARLRELIIEEADKAQRYRAGQLVVGLPESVRRNVLSFKLTSAYEQGDDYVMNFYFTDDLYRPSVDTGDPTYEYQGVQNIIALFNNGYYTPKQTYGWWDGHSAAGYDGAYRSIGSGGAWIRTRNIMPDNEFMQKAADRFNGEFAARYGVKLILDDIYGEGPGLYL